MTDGITYERRSTDSDVINRAVRLLNFASFAILALFLYFVVLAQPASYAVVSRNADLSTQWNPVFLKQLFVVMLTGLAVGSAGLFLNSQRLKRKGDFLRVNLLLVSLSCAIGLLVYLV
jgi:cytochrome bd-type quinol oxidase subunit 2